MKIFNRSLKPEEVIIFLKENPDFFIEHPDAIESLEIKHESGEAVSFIEKQVELIKAKNLETSTKLKEFIVNAKENEILFIKIKKLISVILNSEDLEKLLNFTEDFFEKELGSEKCKIFFFTQDDLFKVSDERVIQPEIATPAFSSIFKDKNIYLGGISNEVASLTFGAKASVKESAICKLNSKEVAGILILGSSSQKKYTSGQDTLFLNFVLEVLSHQIDKLIEVRN